jgi:hypothetical protein
MFCYSPCPPALRGFMSLCYNNFTVHWRGLGQALGCDASREDQIGLMCRLTCPVGYIGGTLSFSLDAVTKEGGYCAEPCPSISPTSCGRMCARDSRACTVTTLTLLAFGVGVFKGVGVVGSEGSAATSVGSFQMVQGIDGSSRVNSLWFPMFIDARALTMELWRDSGFQCAVHFLRHSLI